MPLRGRRFKDLGLLRHRIVNGIRRRCVFVTCLSDGSLGTPHGVAEFLHLVFACFRSLDCLSKLFARSILVDTLGQFQLQPLDQAGRLGSLSPSDLATIRLCCSGITRSGSGRRKPTPTFQRRSTPSPPLSSENDAVGSKLGPRSHCVRQELPVSA